MQGDHSQQGHGEEGRVLRNRMQQSARTVGLIHAAESLRVAEIHRKIARDAVVRSQKVIVEVIRDAVDLRHGPVRRIQFGGVSVAEAKFQRIVKTDQIYSAYADPDRNQRSREPHQHAPRRLRPGEHQEYADHGIAANPKFCFEKAASPIHPPSIST